MRHFIHAALLSVSVAIAAPAFALGESEPVCLHFANSTRDHTVAIIHDNSKSFDQKHAELLSVFENALDMDWIAENVAGAYWRNASSEERKTYTKAYRQYLSDFYISGFDENDLNGINDLALTKFKEREPKNYVVRAQITQKDDEPIDIEFKLVEAPAGTCRIRDFSAEGVDLLASQREEIGSLGEKGGLPYITERLIARAQNK